MGLSLGNIVNTVFPGAGNVLDNVLSGGPEAPPPPDYAGAAAAQGEANKDVTTQQTFANRPNQTTPFGTTTWTPSAGIDPSTGKPVTTWDQNVALNPELQNALNTQIDLQSGRTAVAGDMLDRVAGDFSTPFNWGGAPAAGQAVGPTTAAKSAGEFSADRDKYTQQILDQMRPEHTFQENQTRTMLANQGLTPGSEAYDRELRRLSEAQGRDTLGAIQQGNSLQQMMESMQLGREQQAFGQQTTGFGEQNQARQQFIAEEAQKRGMSLNEMNALLSGQQIGTPQMPNFTPATAAAPAPIFGATVAQGNYGLGAAGINQANYAAQMQGLGQLGGAAMFALA